MESYTEKELEEGIGLADDRPLLAFTYDGANWHTCELNDGIRGNPIMVYTVPSLNCGGWEGRA
jgi:hypothetical protein